MLEFMHIYKAACCLCKWAFNSFVCLHKYIKGLAIIYSIEDKNTFITKFFEDVCLKFVPSIN